MSSLLRLDLVRELIGRELRLRYRRSALGALWSQLGPLVTLAVIAFVFTRVVPLGIPHYAVFALTGILVWNWFSEGIIAATESVVAGRDLVRQPGFPLVALPPVAVGARLAQFLLAFPVLLVAAMVDVGFPGLSLITVPVIGAIQFALILALGYLLAALHVRFRDIGHLVGVALLPLFWASPVFYDTASVPEAWRGLYHLNPLVGLIGAYRAVLVERSWPDWSSLVPAVVVAVAVGTIGYQRYVVTSHRFAEEL